MTRRGIFLGPYHERERGREREITSLLFEDVMFRKPCSLSRHKGTACMRYHIVHAKNRVRKQTY